MKARGVILSALALLGAASSCYADIVTVDWTLEDVYTEGNAAITGYFDMRFDTTSLSGYSITAVDITVGPGTVYDDSDNFDWPDGGYTFTQPDYYVQDYNRSPPSGIIAFQVYGSDRHYILGMDFGSGLTAAGGLVPLGGYEWNIGAYGGPGVAGWYTTDGGFLAFSAGIPASGDVYGSVVGAVPEPSSFVLLGCMLAMGWAACWRLHP
jgi:hypothetical protein